MPEPHAVTLRASGDYFLPVTHMSLARDNSVVRMVFALKQQHSRSLGTSVVTTMEMCALFSGLKSQTVATSSTVASAARNPLPDLLPVDFDYEPVMPPVFVVNVLTYAAEAKGAVFVDMLATSPVNQLVVQASGGGSIAVGAVRLAMSAGLFLSWADAVLELTS